MDYVPVLVIETWRWEGAQWSMPGSELIVDNGALALWAARLRCVNGPNVTWPSPQFSGAVPQRLLERSGRIYVGRPLSRVTRDDLLAGVRPNWRRAIAGARAGAPPPGARTFRMATV